MSTPFEKLIVKLPFPRRSNRKREKSEENKVENINTVKSRKRRERLRNDNTLQKTYDREKMRKRAEFAKYSSKVKERRQLDHDYDLQIKEKERLKKQRQRRNKKKQKEQAAKDQVPTEQKKKGTNKARKQIVDAATVRKRAQRAKQCLPKESMAWASTVNHLVKNATPKRRSLIKISHDEDNDIIADVIGTRTVGRPPQSHSKVKRQLAYTSNAKNMWRCKKSLQQFKHRQTKQSKAISKSGEFKTLWKPKVEKFLDFHSRVMPNKRDTILLNGKPVAKRHLLKSKLKLYTLFKKMNPAFKNHLPVLSD